jgi:UV DNA damage endonuclease
MIRLGLCCIFLEEPIKFRTTTAAAMSRKSRPEALDHLSLLCLANATSLLGALEYCAANGIGCFRINSQILPLKTHPVCGYHIAELPKSSTIVDKFQECGRFAQERGLRTSFHPDQFIVLNSRRPDVVDSSLRELEYHAEVAEWVGADVINVHGGGAYGDKISATADFKRALDRLSTRARSRLTVENDDKVYTPSDLLPSCRSAGVPLVYDVHHHRCNRDGMNEEDATKAAIATWNREPMMHLSSPKDGWGGPNPERHHDFVDIADFPTYWLGKSLTVEVEAKFKELAVKKLISDLEAAEKNGRPNRAKGRGGR